MSRPRIPDALKREKPISIYLTPEEKSRLSEDMKRTGVKRLGAYARHRLLGRRIRECMPNLSRDAYVLLTQIGQALLEEHDGERPLPQEKLDELLAALKHLQAQLAGDHAA